MAKDEEIMALRKLLAKDAPLMLEWMHDKIVVANLNADFSSKSYDDCLRFINDSLNEVYNIHMAIVDNNDIYQGTVSLKNIENRSAEFAIAIRNNAMGKGIAKQAMEDMIRLGFVRYELRSIYWYVSPKNIRAIRFYDKNGYKRVSYDYLKSVMENMENNTLKEYEWYFLAREEWKDMQGG